MPASKDSGLDAEDEEVDGGARDISGGGAPVDDDGLGDGELGRTNKDFTTKCSTGEYYSVALG